MIQAADSLSRRASSAGFGVRPPAFFLIVSIFFTWLIVEALLVARFWIQLTAADATATLGSLVMSLSGPLAAPFQDGQPSITERTNGTVEYGTVMAGEVYLILAVILIVLVFAFSNLLAAGSILWHPDTKPRGMIGVQPDKPSALGSKASRLRNTFFLGLSPLEAQEALRNLRLDRFSLEFVTIAAEGGCVVAVFAPPDEVTARLPFVSRIRAARQEHDASRLLESIGGKLAMPAR